MISDRDVCLSAVIEFVAYLREKKILPSDKLNEISQAVHTFGVDSKVIKDGDEVVMYGVGWTEHLYVYDAEKNIGHRLDDEKTVVRVLETKWYDFPVPKNWDRSN